jgi:dTDP-4-amino-4,6-dideoxygalactose transaminase
MIRLSMACVGVEEENEIHKVLRKTVNFGLGVHVAEFELELSRFIDSSSPPEVICVNTGTAALHIALEALRFPKGSEVLVPSITFLASFSAISAAGLVPVAVDVSLPSCHVQIESCKKLVTSKTVAIMPVAYSGSDFARNEVYEFAKEHNLRVIEDDAHAFGGEVISGKRFGSSGDVVCFSFDGIKNITCGEGGAVVTRDKELAHKIRVMRSLGIAKDVELRYQGKRAWEYDVEVQGFRYHMSNINAAMGLAQLKKIQEFKRVRESLFHSYLIYFKEFELGTFLTPTQSHDSKYMFHIFSCLLAPGIDRHRVREALSLQGVESGIHYAPNHLHSFYKSSYALKNAEEAGFRLLSLPFHANLTSADVKLVCSKLADVRKNL